MRNLCFRMICFYTTVLVLMLATTSLFPGTTGKLRGKVIDIETSEPLPGVNVILSHYWRGNMEMPMDISMGAATDLEGEFFVINVLFHALLHHVI